MSDRIVVRITSGAGESFLDRMIASGGRGHPPTHPERDRADVGPLRLDVDFSDRGHPTVADGISSRTVHADVVGWVRCRCTASGRMSRRWSHCWFASSRRPSVRSWRRSASPAWSVRSRRTSSPRAARQSNWPATWTSCSGQNRNDHGGQSPRDPVLAGRQLFERRGWPIGGAGLGGRRDGRGEEHRETLRGTIQGSGRHTVHGQVRPVHRPNTNERGRF